MVSDLMREFAIGGAVLGTLSALYFYPYVILQIPLGALLDRLGARVLLTLALATAGVGSLIFGFSESLFTAYLGRVLIGVGSAVGFLGSLALAGKWFPPGRFAFLAGLSMFFGMICGMAAQGPLAVFVEAFGWRPALWLLAAAAIVLALLILIFVQNSPVPTSSEKPRGSWRDMWSGLGKAAASVEVWKIAFVAASMSGPMLTIGGLWGTPYVMSAYGLQRPQAAFLVSLILLGWAIGAPLSGWLSDYLGRRKLMLNIGSAILAICLGLIVLVPGLALWMTIGLLVLAGVSGAAMTSTFALARDESPAEISGSVTGIVNSMTVASGAVLQPGVGWVLDLVWDGTMEDGSRIYHAADYRLGFGLILASVLIGFVISLTLRETSSSRAAIKAKTSAG